MQLATPIFSEKIYLRTLQPADAKEIYFEWLLDPEINSYLEVRFALPESPAALIPAIEDAILSSNTLLLAICLVEDGHHIGNIKLGPINFNHRAADIGFLIGDRKYWGFGYAVKAISLVVEYAFTNLELAKVTAGCYERNINSQRALLKAGFTEEGRRNSQYSTTDGRQDGVLYGYVNPLFKNDC
jgi:ribosomal-protein-alanine N-acetyltransferase